MIFGFTGTQRGMTLAQQETLWELLPHRSELQDEFHYGDCIGADYEAFKLAEAGGLFTVCHPPRNSRKRAWTQACIVREPRDYLVRNMNIAKACELLLAAPGEPDEQLRSGTWATVRYARRLRRPVTIVLPDGSVRKET